MKVIKGEPEGSFHIIHEGYKLHVMFLRDYVKHKGFSRFMYDRREDAGEEFSLKVGESDWLKRLAILDYIPNGQIKETCISDNKGAFTLILEGVPVQVMSVAKYASLIGAKSKQVNQWRINSATNDLQGVQIHCNKKSINFVVLKGELESLKS